MWDSTQPTTLPNNGKGFLHLGWGYVFEIILLIEKRV